MNLVMRGLEMGYGGDPVLHGIDLGVDEGSFFVLLGPTGCGKTSLLRTVALLEQPSRGAILFEGSPPPRRGAERTALRRRLAMVRQRPYMFSGSVFDNVSFALRARGEGRETIVHRVAECLAMVELDGFQPRSAGQLSGGETQRVALARALSADPDLLLLDEPLSSIDPPLRKDLRSLLSMIHSQTGSTILMATHNFEEALSLGTHAAIIADRTIQQQGPVSDVFQRPASPFVASFLGMRNVYEVDASGGTARLGELEIVLPEAVDGRINIAIPREAITLSLKELHTSARNVLFCRIESVELEGPLWDVCLNVCGGPMHVAVTSQSVESLDLRPGRGIWASFKASSIHCFPR